MTTTFETALFKHASIVIERIRKIIANHANSEQLTYFLAAPRNYEDPTEKEQAEILRRFHTEGAIIITSQNIESISFTVNNERFKTVSLIHSDDLWALRRAMGAASIEPTFLSPASRKSSTFSGDITTSIPEPITTTPLPPLLDWNDTPCSKREHPAHGMIKTGDGKKRLVISGSYKIEFEGELRCKILDYSYKIENRDKWCLASTVGQAINASSKEVRDAVKEINTRAKRETGDDAFMIIGQRQRGEKINSPAECKWAL